MAVDFHAPGTVGMVPGAGASRLPGPLYSKADGGPASAPTKKPASGIRINPASKLSVAQWAALIKSSDLPDFIEAPIGTTADDLTMPAQIRVPKDTRDREWLPDLLSAFSSGQWELTTCHLDITARIDSTGPTITAEVVPDLSKGEKFSGFTASQMSDTWRKFEDVVITFGWTFEPFDAASSTGVKLNSDRGLILIANTVNLKLGATTQSIAVSDAEMALTFTHEFSVHAGRISENLPNAHGDKKVEQLTADIEEEFADRKGTRVIAQLYKLLKDFADSQKKPAGNSAKRT